jgi:hypothetical protein
MEFFSNPECDASGHGEGRFLLRTLSPTMVTTDDSGTASFMVTILVEPPFGLITATATDPNGNTSAFSRCVGVRSQSPAP